MISKFDSLDSIFTFDRAKTQPNRLAMPRGMGGRDGSLHTRAGAEGRGDLHFWTTLRDIRHSFPLIASR